MRALGILWMRIWFLLIPMWFLLILDNNIDDMIFVAMVVALFLIARKSKYKKSKYKKSKYKKSKSKYKKSKKYVFVIIVIEEDYPKSSSSEDGYADDYENDNFMGNAHDPYPDLDRKLGHIVDQVDDRTFHARFCETDSIVTCYLSHDLFHKNTRPLVGDLVRLEYSSGFGPRIHYIIQVIDSKIKEGSPWVWNIVLAEIKDKYEETDERIFYASLESEQVVLCKVNDYLRHAFIRDGDLVLLEVDERNRSFYKIVEILIHYDPLGRDYLN